MAGAGDSCWAPSWFSRVLSSAGGATPLASWEGTGKPLLPGAGLEDSASLGGGPHWGEVAVVTVGGVTFGLRRTRWPTGTALGIVGASSGTRRGEEEPEGLASTLT